MRWVHEPTNPREPEAVLLRLLEDSAPTVVDVALGSLGFVLDNDSPAEVTDAILAKTQELLTRRDEAITDGLPFLYSRIIEKPITRAKRSELLRVIVDAVANPSTRVRDRGLWGIAELGPKLSAEELRFALEHVKRLLQQDDAKMRASILKFFEDLIKPRYSWRFAWFPDDTAQRLSLDVLDFVLASLDADAPDLRKNAWSLLGRIGALVPKSEHPRVLKRVVDIWQVDRSIPREYLTEVVESVTGVIPERLTEDIQHYKAEKLAERIIAEGQRREMD